MELQNLAQQASQAYQQGQQRQRELDTQAAQRTGEYQQQFGAAQQAQRELQNYIRGLPSGGEQAQKYLQGQYQQLGIDPMAIQRANQQIARTQAALATAPQAAQQAGGGYGMTAGGQAQALANLQGGLTSVLASQTATADALSRQMGQALANAQMIEQSQLTSQEQKQRGYSDVVSLATGLANTASNTMNNIMQLAQQQGSVTAQQVTAYQNARTQLIQAQAAAAAAAAQAALARQQYEANARAEAYNQQLQASGLGGGISGDALKTVSFNQSRDASGNQIGSYTFKSTAGQPINAFNWSRTNNIPFSQLVQTMAQNGEPNAKALLTTPGITINDDGTVLGASGGLVNAVNALGGNVKTTAATSAKSPFSFLTGSNILKKMTFPRS